MTYTRSTNTIINDTAGGDSVKAALTTRLSTAVDNLYAVANLIDADVVTAQTAADGKPDLGETSATAYRGDRGKTAYDHSQTAHAPSNAQKNSDITKEEIEAVLTGELSSHTHASATLPTASDTVSGVVELATTAEAETGTDTTRAVTPAGVAAAITAAVNGLESGDYAAGSTALLIIAEVLPTEFSSFGTILPAGYPPITPIRVFGQAGFVSDDPYKGAYYWVADKPGEATFSVAVAKNTANAVIRWCKNGADLESEITHSSTSYGVYTKTVSFDVGDCISVQVRDTSSSSDAFSKDFKVLIG